jgi:hypothetical protein
MSRSSALPNEIIVLVSPEEAEPSEGQRGWNQAIESIQKQATKLVEVRLEPAVLERQLAGFLGIVGRIFQQADLLMQSESSLSPGYPLIPATPAHQKWAQASVKA